LLSISKYPRPTGTSSTTNQICPRISPPHSSATVLPRA